MLQRRLFVVFLFRIIAKYEMKDKEDYDKDLVRIARIAKAMSHPARLMILQRLLSSECCYSGVITDELPIARSTLSQHLSELKESGLIHGTIESPKIRYCINEAVFKEASDLLHRFLNCC